jgi:hypothetical protein
MAPARFRIVTLLLASCGGAHAVRPSAPEAAETELGFDLRALPTGSSSAQIDLYVVGQGSDIAGRAPRGVTVEVRHVPGTGILYLSFRSNDGGAALAACRDVIAWYMPHAPTLPGMEYVTDAGGIALVPAVDVTAACHAK